MSNEGYKIDLSPYEFKFKGEIIKTDEKTGEDKFVIDPKTGEPKLEEKVSEVDPHVHLSLMICNPQMGGERGQPPEGFDLFELGLVARLIEKAENAVILDQKKYDLLKDRVKKIQKHLNYKYFEMVRRVHEPEKVDLQPKAKAKGEPE